MEQKCFLIVIDSCSKWIEAFYMPYGTNSQRVCEHLNNLFCTFGFPLQLMSDNGPPFDSKHFIEFCRSKGIDVLKSPAYHPQSNGLAERAVQTIKKTLKKELSSSTADHKNI